MPRKARAALAVAAAALFPAAAQAADMTTDCEGLQAALNQAASGNTITLQAGTLCSGSYTMPGAGITLRGQDGAGFKSPGGFSRSLVIDGGTGTSVVDNLRFEGAATSIGGGLFVSTEGVVTVKDATFSGVRNVGSGGGLFVSFASRLTLQDSTFTGNAAALSGGGARISSADAVVTGTTFIGNEAGQNGGGLALTTYADADVVGLTGGEDAQITGNTFTGNRAGVPHEPFQELGGRVADVPPGDSDGTAGGGGLWVGKSGDAIDGPAPDSVPPVSACCASPAVAAEHNVYEGNSIPAGSQSRSGGGAEFAGVDVVSWRERYLRNSVGDAGGGEFVFDSEGGGISVVGTSVRTASFLATNLAVAGNSVGAQGEGGGIYIGTTCGGSCSTTLGLTHATVYGNAVPADGEHPGIAADPNDVISIDRSIVSDAGGTDNVTVTNSDVCPLPGGTGNVCTDPKLADPTHGDVHQTLASPTIDALAAGLVPVVTEDYEGDGRPVTTRTAATPADMGADEFLPADYRITMAASPATVLVGGVITFTANVTNLGPAPAALGATFTLPDGTTAAPSGRAAGDCTGTGPVTCDLGTLGAGASVPFTVKVKATTAGVKTMTGTVNGPDTDTTTGDHTASASATAVLPTATPTPKPGGGVSPAKNSKRCGSRRYFTIRVRKLRGVTFVKASIRVNGNKAKVVKRHGRFLTRVDLRKIGKKTIRVRIRAVSTTGRVYKNTRRYHPCRRGSKKTVPKL